jgi:hypothetical protein
MSLATTRLPTPSTHTNVRPTLTRLTYTSRLACSSFKMDKHPLVGRTRGTPRFRKTYTHKPTNLPMFMVRRLQHGVPLSRRSLLQVLLPQPWRPGGIDLWLKSAIQVFHLNS